MNDIDKLIIKYGAENLLSSIYQRLEYPAFFQNHSRKGAPKHHIGELWGLRQAFHHFQALYPYEKQEYIADRILFFLNNYRGWLKKPDLYAPELSLNKHLFNQISWMGSYGKRKITSKTIINKLGALKKEDKKFAKRMVDTVFDNVEFSIYPPGWSEGDDLNNY